MDLRHLVIHRKEMLLKNVTRTQELALKGFHWSNLGEFKQQKN